MVYWVQVLMDQNISYTTIDKWFNTFTLQGERYRPMWASSFYPNLVYSRPNNLSLVSLYLSLYISFLLFGHFFLLTHWDRKHYYIKVVESIQFVCTGNSGISRVLCNANTYRSIHEGLFFNFSPALDLKYPLRLPYIHFYFSSLHLQYRINVIHS